MFDNILFQHEACTKLQNNILQRAIPPAILIYGAPLSAKTTLALELARILTCQNKMSPGQWTCPCWSCQQQRELSHSQSLILGTSNFSQEILVCRKFFDQALENKAQITQLKILLLVWLRSLNKILKRYDPALWKDGKDKTTKERKAQKAQEEFVELLATLRPKHIFTPAATNQEAETIFTNPSSLQKNLDRCQELAEVLISAIPQSIPIQQIRQLQQWSYQTSEISKVAILENVDTMNVAASNAMLKLLEEPPENCYFILTTRKKQVLLPTILSRLRLIGLRERTIQEEQQIVQKIFRTTGTENLKELFLTNEQDSSFIRAECELFIDCLHKRQPFFILKSKMKTLDLEIFLLNLSFALHIQCTQQYDQVAKQQKVKLNLAWYQKFLKLSRNAIERHRVYHEPAMLLLQNIYLELSQEC